MDNHTAEQRHRNMSAVRSRDTKPELLLRRKLHSCGYRFRLCGRDLPGKPDIILPKYKSVIFVHGCFWHRHPGCRYASTPGTNREFWEKKFVENTERDRRQQEILRSMGWNVIVIWTCEIKKLVEDENFAGRIGLLLSGRGKD